MGAIDGLGAGRGVFSQLGLGSWHGGITERQEVGGKKARWSHDCTNSKTAF